MKQTLLDASLWLSFLVWFTNLAVWLLGANWLLALVWGEVRLAPEHQVGGLPYGWPLVWLVLALAVQAALARLSPLPRRRWHGVVLLEWVARLPGRVASLLQRWLPQPLAAAVEDLALVWLPLRVVLLGVMWLAERFFLPQMRLEPGLPRLADWFWDFLLRWDAFWYLDIAGRGYLDKAGKWAFFPLYPLAVRGLAEVTGLELPLAGLLVSHLCLVLALVGLYAAYLDRLGRPALRWALLLLCVWPGSYFFSSLYTESMFLLWAVLAFWAWRARRPALAGLAGALAAATRPPGIVLWPALALGRWLESRRWERGQLWLLLIPAGLTAFLAYAWWASGDPLAFLHAQGHWQRQPAWPWQVLGEHIDHLLNLKAITGTRQLSDLVDLASVVLVSALVPVVWRRLGRAEALYCLGSLAFALASGSLYSFTRFSLVLFPVFLALGWSLAPRAWLGAVLASGLAFLGTLYGVIFALWRWSW